MFPKTESGRLTTWVGVGGSPQSVVRTAHYGLPLMLAIIGGAPDRFAPLPRPVPARGRAVRHRPRTRSACTRPGFIADTDEEAKELFWPHYKVMRDRIGALRGWPPIRREEFDAEVEHGSLYVGSPRDRRPQDRPRRRRPRRRPLRPDLHRRARMPASARLRAVELYGTQGDPDGPRDPRRQSRDRTRRERRVDDRR